MMILTKTPVRIPLAGGGTDLPLFTKRNIGSVMPMAINQYIYTYISKRTASNSSIIQTSNLQEVKINSKIRHKIINETLNYFKVKDKIHIGFFSTLPTRSGIGSSSSLIVGLINSIIAYKKKKLSKYNVAKIAIEIERKILNEDGGIQDQISASFGGINLIKCFKNYKFSVKKIKLNKKNIYFLENSLILVFSNIKRYSSKIIKSQKQDKINHYKIVKKEVNKIIKIIESNSKKELGRIFNEHWLRKMKLSNEMTNKRIDDLYKKIMNNKYFYGGKLIGAGGGGFYVFVVKNKNKANKYLKSNNFDYREIKIDLYGSKTIFF